MTGRVGPKSEVAVPIDITWTAQVCIWLTFCVCKYLQLPTTQGSFNDAFLRCNVLDMEKPLFASLSAQVKGLSVMYRLLPNQQDEKWVPTVESG